MSGGLMLTSALGLLGFCIAAETVQQLSFKVGVDRAGGGPAAGVLAQPLVWLGVFIWVVESIAWVLALERTPLSVAYPVMTLSYATVPLMGLVLLRERMTARQLLGAGLIFGGVVCVGASGA